MSDITQLSTRQKTDLLAHAAGWTIDGVIVRDADGQNIGICWEILSRPSRVIPDLYEPKNMALSWNLFVDAWVKGGDFGESVEAVWDMNQHDIICYPAEGALRILMDMVLECAIEAGLVQLEDATA